MIHKERAVIRLLARCKACAEQTRKSRAKGCAIIDADVKICRPGGPEDLSPCAALSAPTRSLVAPRPKVSGVELQG